MKFYEIQEDKIINLETIRTAQVLDNVIYLTFTCGDIKSERADLKAMNYCNFFLQQLSVAEVKEIEDGEN